MRWIELSPAWQACLEQAWEAYTCGCVPVGAVVVNPAGEIVSLGRNRINEQSAPPHQVCSSQLAHAELNALLALDSAALNPRTCAIYTSLEPCPLCLGAIYMSGVRNIYYAAGDAYAGATDLLGKTPYLSHKPVKAFGPFPGGLAEFGCAIHADFILRRTETERTNGQGVIEANRIAFPRGIELAEKLVVSGVAQDWARAGKQIGEVFDLFQAFAGLSQV